MLSFKHPSIITRHLTLSLFIILLARMSGQDLFAQCSNCFGYSPAAWPSTWVSYKYKTGFAVKDTADESPGESDIYFGPAADSASVLVAFQNETAFFRFQLRGNPAATGGAAPLKQSTWLVQIRGANGYHLLTVGADGNNPDNIFILDTTGTQKLIVYTLSSSPDAVRILPVGGTSQYYLDFQMPICLLTYWSCLYARQTITQSTRLIFYYGTSQAASSNVNKDFSTCSFSCTLTIFDYLALMEATFQNISSGILPVELRNFRAEVRNRTVYLKWQTVTESNNYGFEVERRKEETPWEKAGFIPGHGSSSKPNYYSFEDRLLDAAIGEVFYRLQQLDRDGTVHYSPTVIAHVGSVQAHQLLGSYPNPATANRNTTVLSYSVGSRTSVRISLINHLGQEVRVLTDEDHDAGTYSRQLYTADLPAGVYLAVMSPADGSPSQRKPVMILK